MGLCADCWSQIHAWTGPACPRCGLPIATQLATDESDWLCGKCRVDEYDFDFARSFSVYAEPLRSAILLLKFQRRERLGSQLGELLAELWFDHPEFANAERPILAPVPLHRSRQRQRGFNQAEVLARGLARRLRKESHRTRQQIETRCLLRIRPTVPQTGLTFKQRLENVRGVFRVNSPEAVKGRVIVLLDDVMTTGATLSSCAGGLKKAGAARVLGLTLARATPQFPDGVSPAAEVAVDEFN